jgi:hypothetical protein
VTRWVFWLAAAGAVVAAAATALAVRTWIRFEDVVDAGALFLSFGSYQSARDNLDVAVAACTLVGMALLVCLALFAAREPAWHYLRAAALLLVIEVLLRVGVIWADGSTAREIRRGYIVVTVSTLGLLATCVAIVFAVRNYSREGNTASMR